MNHELIVQCHDCLHFNKQYLGVEGKEMKEVEYSDFSSAHKHAIENPDHYMSFIIREVSEEE